ncbi:TonB-dependent receptor plug domain-containing protein [Mucilaginibacter sp. UC70_90]
MKRYLILFITFILVKTLAFGQTTIQGTVTDANTHEAIAGASICNADAATGAKLGMTNAKGHFSINAQDVNRLKFAMVGYSARIIEVSAIKGQKLDVALEPSTVDLQPVVVTASREGQARQDAPIAISKINSTQIKDTKATALYQLLNKVAGVYMVNLGNEQHTMAIRQPITYNALYLYMEDGVPIRPTGIFNHNSLYEINMSGVKDIEVIKGPASSLYGSNSIGGAVNFITQGPPTGYAGNVLLRAITTIIAALMPMVVLHKANLVYTLAVI